MSEQSEEYERYVQIAKQKQYTKQPKQKVLVWKLVFIPLDEKVIHGSYSLCQKYKNEHKNDKRYKILPL